MLNRLYQCLRPFRILCGRNGRVGIVLVLTYYSVKVRRGDLAACILRGCPPNNQNHHSANDCQRPQDPPQQTAPSRGQRRGDKKRPNYCNCNEQLHDISIRCTGKYIVYIILMVFANEKSREHKALPADERERVVRTSRSSVHSSTFTQATVSATTTAADTQKISLR